MTRETVGPEGVLALPECNLQPYTFRLVSIALEEVEGMLEGWRAALDAIIHPCGSVFGGVQGYGGSLSANYRHAFNNSDFVLLRVLSEGCSAGLSRRSTDGRQERKQRVADHASSSTTNNDHLLPTILN